MDKPKIIPAPPMVAFLERLGLAPLDVDGNELHYRLAWALRDAKDLSHTERLVVVRGVLASAHETVSNEMSKAQAKYETKLKTVKADLVKDGKPVSAATVIAEGEAQEFRNAFLAAQSEWRALKEYSRTVDKDFDRARSDQADARQGNHVSTYGGGAQ